MEQATINWYRSPIEKETLRQLTRKSDLRGWLQAGSFLLIYLALTAFALYLSRVRLWVPMVIVSYIQSVLVSFYMGLASAVHGLGHGTPFKSKPVNEFLLYLFSLLTWSDPVHFRASHIQNHRPFILDRGRDMEVIQVPVKEKLNWVNVLSWFTFDFKWCAVCMRANVLHALSNANASRAMGGSAKEMIVMCGANGRI
jgi:fatty acid desaturase